MSTDAFFFFHMDRDGDRDGDHPPAANMSTSSSSIVSSHARKQFLVEYSPKPARAIGPVGRAPVHHQHHHQQPTTQTQAIRRWLATHRSYEPIEHSSFSSDEESEADAEDDEESESDSEDDQIYMAPRRQHSSPSIAITVPEQTPAPLPTIAIAVPRRAWPLSAARPALPVVDRAEATAFTTALQDKSHWSDDEEDLEADVDDEEQEWLEDDLDLPALEEDSGAPASTSTPSLPIPIYSNPIDVSDTDPAHCIDNEHDLDALWNSSPHSHNRRRPSRKVMQDGQSFWTPWIKDYMATQN